MRRSKVESGEDSPYNKRNPYDTITGRQSPFMIDYIVICGFALAAIIIREMIAVKGTLGN